MLGGYVVNDEVTDMAAIELSELEIGEIVVRGHIVFC